MLADPPKVKKKIKKIIKKLMTVDERMDLCVAFGASYYFMVILLGMKTESKKNIFWLFPSVRLYIRYS